MTTTAKIILDSHNGAGDRLTTLQLRYPAIIHPQLLTHRVFSRNVSSNRAIPVEKLIEDVERDPFVPERVGRNQKGMQAEEYLEGAELRIFQHFWLIDRDHAVAAARRYAEMGVHKQTANRLLMPFAHVNVVLTATEFDNWFNLRLDHAAQPEIQELARAMRAAMDASTPRLIRQWGMHIPYVRQDELDDWGIETATKVSVARCARVSYLTHEGKASPLEKDLQLAADLQRDGHWSPFEHQAESDPRALVQCKWGNFRGWIQNRKELE